MADGSFWIETEDWHTAGEPFRIVKDVPAGLLPSAPTVAERRREIMKTPGHPLDILRQSLCHEPRGHADMYGGFITPPDDAGAHFGVLFWHKDGFSTACGHGTIALGYWALGRGLVRAPESGEGAVDVVVDVPSGRVTASLVFEKGRLVQADFVNVTSYQLARGLPVQIPSRAAEVSVDLAFGGAVYATLDSAVLGLQVVPANVDEFIKLGREIKASLGEKGHYGAYDLYGVIFFEEQAQGDRDGTVLQRNVTVFADGQIDRSPCGSGTAARVAVLLSEGRLKIGDASKLVHGSIVGSRFEASIISEAKSPVNGFSACIPRVTGQANLVGRMNFFIDPGDPIYPGFLFR